MLMKTKNVCCDFRKFFLKSVVYFDDIDMLRMVDIEEQVDSRCGYF